jgi:hypothetical protein
MTVLEVTSVETNIQVVSRSGLTLHKQSMFDLCDLGRPKHSTMLVWDFCRGIDQPLHVDVLH